jgi:hypothetical protein
MTPLGEIYKLFIETVRDVIETVWLSTFVANDRQYKNAVIDNVRSHMERLMPSSPKLLMPTPT